MTDNLGKGDICKKKSLTSKSKPEAAFLHSPPKETMLQTP